MPSPPPASTSKNPVPEPANHTIDTHKAKTHLQLQSPKAAPEICCRCVCFCRPRPLSHFVTAVPYFVTCCDISPRSGRVFPKVGAFGSPCQLHLFAKASPLGRGGIAQAMTERASTPALFFIRSRPCPAALRQRLRPLLPSDIPQTPTTAAPRPFHGASGRCNCG